MKKSSCNGRSIYENCESNDRFISAMTRREMEQLLSKVKEDVQAQNKTWFLWTAPMGFFMKREW